MGAIGWVSLAGALLFSTPAKAGPIERWRPLIEQASVRFGIPARWIEQVMIAESRGLTDIAGHPIRSRAGAMGLMQLMPATWAAMRNRLGLGANPDDPGDNIQAGSFYLRLMYDRFGYPGLFAAYNAGPARYADHLASGVNLPAETRAYVARAAGVARDPSPAAPISGRHAPALFAVAPAEGVSPPSRAAAINMFGSLFVDLRGTAGR